MENQTGEAGPSNLKRLFWVGPLTVVSSALAVFLTRAVAVAILTPPATFVPLTVQISVFDGAIFSAAAVLVFLAKCRYDNGASARVSHPSVESPCDLTLAGRCAR